MLRALVFVGAILASLVPAASVRADHEPVIVVPSRPGIPVMINGRDASWCVVEGDWGLYRPGSYPTVICPAPWVKYYANLPRRIVSKDPWSKSGYSSAPAYGGRGYYPAYGSRPERGRLEVEPPPDRALPEPAESYSRSWSSDSPRRYKNEPDQHKGPQTYQEQQPYSQGSDVPATITDPNAFNPPMIVVPQINRRP
jgi:hypothetical protein